MRVGSSSWEEACSCGRGFVLVEGGLSLWKRYVLVGGGSSVVVRGLNLCEGACPCGRGCVPVEGGFSLWEEACQSL